MTPPLHRFTSSRRKCFFVLVTIKGLVKLFFKRWPSLGEHLFDHLLVVSTILNYMLFVSFWYCGDYYKYSFLFHSCSKKKLLVEMEHSHCMGGGINFLALFYKTQPRSNKCQGRGEAFTKPKSQLFSLFVDEQKFIL